MIRCDFTELGYPSFSCYDNCFQRVSLSKRFFYNIIHPCQKTYLHAYKPDYILNFPRASLLKRLPLYCHTSLQAYKPCNAFQVFLCQNVCLYNVTHPCQVTCKHINQNLYKPFQEFLCQNVCLFTAIHPCQERYKPINQNIYNDFKECPCQNDCLYTVKHSWQETCKPITRIYTMLSKNVFVKTFAPVLSNILARKLAWL